MNQVDVTFVENLLQTEEQAGPILHRDEREECCSRRAALATQIADLSSHVSALTSRLRNLPTLADTQQMNWANAILKFRNLAIVVLDTTGVSDDSDIIRVIIADASGTITRDLLIRPMRQSGHANTRYTGIDRTLLLEAPTLTDVWEQITDDLTGRYTLAYNLEFVRNRLQENATNYGLEPITIIGECLMERARLYYNNYSSLKLVDICARIGCTLPN
ncbi:MAG: hypothetical protein H0U76_25760, partial [Ktedonobacteraceae bacterium]|nr:hypothetical protein [Ktedonobacteraceae bacterium]